MTLKEYNNILSKFLIENPEAGELPLIYSDPKGKEYSIMNCEPIMVEAINYDGKIKIIGYFNGDETDLKDNPSKEDLNYVLVN